MSSPLEPVRETFERWNARDLDGWLALWHPDGEWTPGMRAAVEGGTPRTYRGHAELREFWEDDASVWDLLIVIDDLREEGDAILAFGRAIAKGHESGASAEQELAWRFEIRDGLIAKARTFTDPDDALR